MLKGIDRCLGATCLCVWLASCSLINPTVTFQEPEDASADSTVDRALGDAAPDTSGDGAPRDARPDGCGDFYRDMDDDGFGDRDAPSCVGGPGFASNASDCDDSTALRSPALAEACNGLDSDCDGQVDEGLVGPIGSPVDLGISSTVSTVRAYASTDGFVLRYAARIRHVDAQLQTLPGGTERSTGMFSSGTFPVSATVVGSRFLIAGSEAVRSFPLDGGPSAEAAGPDAGGELFGVGTRGFLLTPRTVGITRELQLQEIQPTTGAPIGGLTTVFSVDDDLRAARVTTIPGTSEALIVIRASEATWLQRISVDPPRSMGSPLRVEDGTQRARMAFVDTSEFGIQVVASLDDGTAIPAVVVGGVMLGVPLAFSPPLRPLPLPQTPLASVQAFASAERGLGEILFFTAGSLDYYEQIGTSVSPPMQVGSFQSLVASDLARRSPSEAVVIYVGGVGSPFPVRAVRIGCL